MYIRSRFKKRGGWTLPEMMVAVGLFSLSGLVLMGLYLFCVKGMASMYNYSLLDQYNRQAMDQLTREIRQATQVVGYTTNSITIQAGTTNGSAGPQVTYSFIPSTQKLVRSSTDGSFSVLLNNCSLLTFNLYSRIPLSGSYECYPVATNNWSQTVKVLQLTWKTSISLPSGVLNSENIQTARVVIRKQQDS